MKQTRFIFSIILTCALLAVPALAAEPARKDAPSELVTELLKKGFNTLVAAVAKTDLVNNLAGPDVYTVLGPTDVAFRNLSKAQLDSLMADKEKLTKVLSGHVIEGKVSSDDLKSGKYKTLAGTTIEARVVDGKIKIANATVVKPDVVATNGIIHGIDQILLE